MLLLYLMFEILHRPYTTAVSMMPIQHSLYNDEVLQSRACFLATTRPPKLCRYAAESRAGGRKTGPWSLAAVQQAQCAMRPTLSWPELSWSVGSSKGRLSGDCLCLCVRRVLHEAFY